jgi:hypothetical protein
MGLLCCARFTRASSTFAGEVSPAGAIAVVVVVVVAAEVETGEVAAGVEIDFSGAESADGASGLLAVATSAIPFAAETPFAAGVEFVFEFVSAGGAGSGSVATSTAGASGARPLAVFTAGEVDPWYALRPGCR